MNTTDTGANPEPAPAANDWISGVDHFGLDGEPVDGAPAAGAGGPNVVVLRVAATNPVWPEDMPVRRRRLGPLIFLSAAVIVVAGAAVSFTNLYFAINREPDRTAETVAVAVAEPAAAVPLAKDEARLEPTVAVVPAVPRQAVAAPPEQRDARAEPVVEVDDAGLVPVEDVIEEPLAAEDPLETDAPVEVAGAADGVITRSVNLRAGPDNGSAVIGVIEAGTPVAVLSCDYWCEIDIGGRRGFVFRSFLTAQR